MSRGATITLGILFVVLTFGCAGVAAVSSETEALRAATKGMALTAVFCAVGAIACLFPAARPIALRLIAGTVFLVCLAYLIGMLISGPRLTGSRGETSLLNSVIAFSVFGLPAAYVMFKGRYPRWGDHAEVFGAADLPHLDSTSDDPGVER